MAFISSWLGWLQRRQAASRPVTRAPKLLTLRLEIKGSDCLSPPPRVPELPEIFLPFKPAPLFLGVCKMLHVRELSVLRGACPKCGWDGFHHV